MDTEDQTDGRPSDLTALAEAKFGKETLSDAEKLLLEKVPSGDFAICGPNRDRPDSNPTKADDDDPNNDPRDTDKWGQARQIRAELVAWLCTDHEARKRVHWRGIRVYGADVTGLLDLSFVNIPFQLAFRRCRLTRGINLAQAEVSQLDFQGTLVYGIFADRVNVKDYVALRYGFLAVGVVWLLGARIGGDLDCDLGTFFNPPKPPKQDDPDPSSGIALNAQGIEVKGNVFLRGSFANGDVTFVGAQIGGMLDCTGGAFVNPLKLKEGLPESFALNAEQINVKGGVFLRSGFTADGAVNLYGARIGGPFDCRMADFHKTTLYLMDASAASLYDSGVNDVLGVSGADSRVTNLPSVSGTDSGVNDVPAVPGVDSGVNEVPGVSGLDSHVTNLPGVSGTDSGVNDVPAVPGADSGVNDDPAVSVADSRLTKTPAVPASNFSPTVWPQCGNLLLDGFFYGRISSPGRINVAKRLDWLGRQPSPPFLQRPYLQLAKVLRESGDSDAALQVLEKMEELRRSAEEPGASKWLDRKTKKRMARLWSQVLKTSIGYGYRPGKAIWLILLLSVLGWIVYGTSYDVGTMVPTEKEAYQQFKDLPTEGQVPAHYPTFSAPVYSLENSLPLVKLGQADKWQPDPAPDGWAWVRWFLRVQVLLGWLLATLFVAGVSGIVRKE